MIPAAIHDLGPGMDRLQRIALVVGIAGLALCGLELVRDPAQFQRSYLIGFLLWCGVMVGSMAMLMLHHLAGGGWGYLIRRPLEAAMRTWPLVALMVVPILFGTRALFPWADPAVVASSEALRHKQVMLNVPAFIARAPIYFLIWGVMITLLNRWSGRQDSSSDPSLVRKLQNLSGPGLVIFALSGTFAATDWVMSLEPEWFSSVFPGIVLIGWALSGIVFAILVLPLLINLPPLRDLAAPKYLNDLGNMMFTFLLVWAYLQVGQLIIIWSGNITEEIPFYLRRMTPGWEQITVLLAVFHFFVPFVLLLQRNLKRRIEWLWKMAALLFVLRLVNMVWDVGPAFDPTGFRFHWADWVAPVGIGGVWVAFFVRQLKRRPLLPLEDPRLPLVYERIELHRVGDVN
ncbi:MAG: hypothetical protein IT160_01050 [Bryobacterales bacterium]|nr:hypothetical protein [Bryobacterales bacterium]